MGLFNVFKKDKKEEKKEEKAAVEYRPLQARLMFADYPELDQDVLRTELMKVFDTLKSSEIKEKHFAYTFPDHAIEHEGQDLAAQIQLFLPVKEKPNFIGVHPKLVEQSAYLKDAHLHLSECKFELLITDFPYEGNDFETRLKVFNNFLLAITIAMKPKIVFSVSGQKLLLPGHITQCLTKGDNFNPMFTCVNMRRFRIKETPEDEYEEVLIDTLGLNSFGLRDIQIKSYGLKVADVSDMIWMYTAKTLMEGAIMEEGDTVKGKDADLNYTCQLVESVVHPKRDVVNLIHS